MSLRVALLLLCLVPLACGPRRAPAGEGSVPAGSEQAALAGEAKPVLVDEVVASVQGRPITLSELEIEVRLERALAGDLAGASGEVSPADEASVLPELIDRAAVIGALHGRYGKVLDPHLEEAELKQLEEEFGSPEAWAAFRSRLELSQEEIGQRLRRREEEQTILAARLVELVHVDKQAIDEWLAANPTIRNRGEAEKRLTRERQEEKKLEVLNEARKKTAARVVDPTFAPPSEGMARSPERTAH